MKRWILGLALLLAALMATVAALQLQQQQLAGKLVRLHVVANSDTEEDQALKLLVRDAVLEAVEGLNEDELVSSLHIIRLAARDQLRAQGSSYSVDVDLVKEEFPTRAYETFTLPAGVYKSLRVTIGNGDGQNWWCVVFPAICFRATAADLEAAAVAAGFTQDEVTLITKSEDYVLRFKALELLVELKKWLLVEE